MDATRTVPISSRLRRALSIVPLVFATGLLAERAISGILKKLGHPGAALDDAYIHFQYARAFAEGHPFRFQAGEPISTGATSLLWPALLAPFYAIGFHGQTILWPAWFMSFTALGALAHEAYRLASPLSGRPAAIGAAGMVLAFGGYAWCAASGMEVVPFAWLIAFSTRRACEWAEASPDHESSIRTRRRIVVLAVLAAACPLMRPEGAITSLALGAVVAIYPRRGAHVVRGVDVSRLEVLWFVLATSLPNLIVLLLTGSATSSTAQVKLLIGNPYFALGDAVLANVRILLGTILDGELWSAEFLPKGGAVIACLGLTAIVWRGMAAKRWVRAALVLLLALSMFVPCLYVTFLWNRLRYLWPFATGWIIGLACFARAVAAIASRIDRRTGPAAAALVAGGFAGAFLVRVEWVLEDVSQSASGIDRQQSALGRWAKTNLPEDARIGVNDTGAVAYFSGRKTFDVVGLTTPTEGRFWVGGAASRLEHYERVHATAPALLPTHFIVYPEWLGCPPIVGRLLHEAVVTDSTILGGQTMQVTEARWTNLGTGERPWSTLGTIDDSVDVADLESEAAHGYELLGAREGEQTVVEASSPSETTVLDGGRTRRLRDAFFVQLPADKPLRGIARVENDGSASVFRITVAGKEIARPELASSPWSELAFDIPPDTRGRVKIEIASETPFTSFHYWFGSP